MSRPPCQHDSMPDLVALVSVLGLAGRDHAQLVLESLALRQQPAVFKRRVVRPNIKDTFRIFWLRRSQVMGGCRVSSSVTGTARSAVRSATPLNPWGRGW